MALPESLNRTVAATAALTTTELFNEGQSAAADPKAWPFARIDESLDGRHCPLCAAVHGKVMAVTSPEYAQWRQPSHINCRRVLHYINAEAQGTKVTFKEPKAELIRKHGHYHLDPKRHAEFRFPATPAGRHFIVRRVKHLETDESAIRIDWAPWWQQVPQWKRALALQARGTFDAAELEQLLERLGITNFNDPQQRREVMLLGLADRVEGWITIEETSFERKVATIERKIAKRAKERAWIISPEGETVYRKVGRAREISFRPDEQVHFRGNIFIHNHPGGSSFSPADVEIAAKSGVIEFRAITDTKRFVLRPPKGGWPDGWWASVGREAFQLVDMQVRGELRDLVNEGIMEQSEANARVLHEVWTRMAERFGFYYASEER